LSPDTANRQGVGIRDLFGNAPSSPVIDYDPITRTLTLSNPNPGMPFLISGQSYELVFPVFNADSGPFGLVAIDGATMDPTTPTIAFPVIDPLPNPPTYPTVHFCADVMPIFRVPLPSGTEGACGGSTCHGLSAPPNPLQTSQGLVLDTEDGVLHTAIGVAAEETTTTAATGAISPQAIFPAGMPIIDPGYPANSYLLYKLLKYDDGVPDASGASIAYTPTCFPITQPFNYGPAPGFASVDEETRLANLVPGRRMPWGGTPLTIDEMERIRLWILQGAQVEDCSSCYASSP
jgi:hypothetical protein